MSLFEILLLAFALSIDACVVSFSYGVQPLKNALKPALSLALFTGIFQGLMPLLGGLCTNCIKCYIQPFSKWIVFAIFIYLGINFIKDSFEENNSTRELTLGVLFLIAIATSIDAFSAGIPLSLKCHCIFMPVLIIGLVTFINSLIGFFVGKIFKNFSPKFLEILGGIILIALAIKVI